MTASWHAPASPFQSA